MSQWIIARCAKCHAVVYGIKRERLDRAARGQIDRLMARGYNIEHVPVEVAREAEWECACNKEGQG